MYRAHTMTLRGTGYPPKRSIALRQIAEQIDRAEQELRRTCAGIAAAVEQAERELRRLGRKAAAGASAILVELALSFSRLGRPLPQ